MIASRILSYGKDYEFEYDGVEQNVDLSTIEPKKQDESLYESGNNEFYLLLKI